LFFFVLKEALIHHSIEKRKEKKLENKIKNKFNNQKRITISFKGIGINVGDKLLFCSSTLSFVSFFVCEKKK